MAVYGQQIGYEVERTGTFASVPDNDIARLMYYLHCVSVVVDLHDEPNFQRFTSFEQWYNLSDTEKKQLYQLCTQLSPDRLHNKVFFQESSLCPDASNEFYEIRQVQNHLLVSDSVVIAGRQHRINNIMAYKPIWLNKNYYEPMQRLSVRLSGTYKPALPSSSYTTVKPSGSKCKKICSIVCAVGFFVFVVIGIIIYFVNR